MFALTLLSYLKNCKKRDEINNSTSTTKDVIAGVLQGSIDDTLLLNIFINNLIIFILYSIPGNYITKNFLTFLGGI